MTDAPSFLPHDDSPRAHAEGLLRYINASPSPFHAVANAAAELERAGYQRLDEARMWSLSPDTGYYLVRGGGTVVAFRTGTRPAREAGFRVVGAHTDSPNLRLKPRLAKAAHGLLQLDLEPYGGLLVATWADRDLALAGRLVVRGPKGHTERLVRTPKAVCRIPNLAIHLNRAVNDEGLKLNKHSHLGPVVAMWAGEGEPEAWLKAHLAELAGVAPADILGHDLMLFDVQDGAFTGANDDFISVARLDNLGMSYAGLVALLRHDLKPAAHSRVLSLFDHEEVGSQSTRGADSTLMTDVLGRLAGDGADALPRAIARSHQVSADMAHALHPNYADRHDGTHQPLMNGGPVIKTNVNTRYATDGVTAALFRAVCEAEGVPCQEFVNRPDLACGSTIGSITAGRLGLATVDVGNPMWAMHSIREMAGAHDPLPMARALGRFLQPEA
ncbi:MAG: M18 family aminopeptidase [Myxococcales bacterium]|nr:M18 family aminopeptidase [Myxococcales bacterium]